MTMHYFHLDQAKATEAAKLRDLSSRCEHERRFWAATIDELKKNINVISLVLVEVFLEHTHF